jgi:hypothetical protein
MSGQHWRGEKSLCTTYIGIHSQKGLGPGPLEDGEDGRGVCDARVDDRDFVRHLRQENQGCVYIRSIAFGHFC